MTVRFIKQWNGYLPGLAAMLPADQEAALIAGGFAIDAVATDQAASAIPPLGGEARKLLSVNSEGTGLQGVNQVQPVVMYSMGGGNSTLTGSQVLGGVVTILRAQTFGDPATWTMPSAEELLAAAPWLVDSPLYGQTGVGALWIIRKSDAGLLTLADGDGVTINGENTVASGKARGFFVFAVDNGDGTTSFEMSDAFLADL